jgi:hypothetical protein
MKRPHLEGDRFDAREMSNAALTASMFAASVGMIWDLATGHVSAFDRMLSNISDDDQDAANTAVVPQQRARSIAAAQSHLSIVTTEETRADA